MREFVSKRIPKTNILGVDVCLFEWSTCMNYHFEMVIDWQMLLMFHMQQFIPKMYIKEILKGKVCVKQQDHKMRSLEKRKLHRKGKTRKLKHLMWKRVVGKSYRWHWHSYTQILVYVGSCPYTFWGGRNHFINATWLSSICAKIWNGMCPFLSDPASLPNKHIIESSYFEALGKSQFNDDRYRRIAVVWRHLSLDSLIFSSTLPMVGIHSLVIVNYLSSLRKITQNHT